MQSPNAILDPAAVSKLANLHLKARAIVEGFLTGLHKSPYHGFSVEFSQHRPYMPGDSLRMLDYKVLAKTGRYYIKQYEEETNLKAFILFDHSGSMGFTSGDGRMNKLDYAKSLAAAVTLLLLRQRDATGLVTFSGEVTGILPPKSAMGWLDTLLTRLEALKSVGPTRVAAALYNIAERVQRKGLVILISDLMDEPEATLAGLKALRHIGHDVIVFQVLDPFERTFAFPRDGRFKDMETGELISSRPWHIRDAYYHAVEEFLETYRLGCRSHNVDYELCQTDGAYGAALLKFLDRRRRMM